DRKPKTLWREGEPADGRGYFERLLFTLGAADEGGLAHRPGIGAVGIQRDIVDPAAFRVERERCNFAFGIERNQLAVVAAHDDALAVGDRTENPPAVDRDLRDLTLRVDKSHAFLGADKDG